MFKEKTKLGQNVEESRTNQRGQEDIKEKLYDRLKRNPTLASAPDSQCEPHTKTEGDEETIRINRETVKTTKDGNHTTFLNINS